MAGRLRLALAGAPRRYVQPYFSGPTRVTAFHPITIVGGGLAGLTLGVALRQRDVPVILYEAGVYPRHRVCGEFICVRGIDVLQNLGLYPKFLAAGAVEARSAAFHSAGRSYRPKALPRAALCLSRYTMDLVHRYNRVRFAQLLAGCRRSLRAV